MSPFRQNPERGGSVPKKRRAPRNFFEIDGTPYGLTRYAVRIVTFCPPALAIQNMGPDALTSPPPGGASGLNFVWGPSHYQLEDGASFTMRFRMRLRNRNLSERF